MSDGAAAAANWFARAAGRQAPQQQPQAQPSHQVPGMWPQQQQYVQVQQPQQYQQQPQQRQQQPTEISPQEKNRLIEMWKNKEIPFSAIAQFYKGGKSKNETTRCPECNGNNFFSRKNLRWGGKTPAPLCADCGFNGMYMQYGAMAHDEDGDEFDG